MKNLVILVVLVLAVIFGKRYYDGAMTTAKTDAARSRVESTLDRIRAGNAEQEALSFWAKGKPTMSEDEMRMHTDAFDRWRRDTGLVTVREFRIESAASDPRAGEVVTHNAGPVVKWTPDSRSGEVVVQALVDGKSHTFRVRPGTPIDR